jgi:hypothetical protein
VRVLPEPSHEPVGFSYETFPGSRRWIALAAVVIVTIAAGVAAALLLA